MTVSELWIAAREARASDDPSAGAKASSYEVEVHKKFALSAAVLILALAAVAFPIRFPRGGMFLVMGATVVVVGAYYFTLIGGEWLADRQRVSPFLAMWIANLLVLAVSLLVMPRRDSRASDELAPPTP